MKHTPGPWGFEDKDNDHMITAGKDSRGRFRYVCDPSYSPNKQERANAHLIAAAPELYAALKHILWNDRISSDEWLLKTRAAIAKAEGRKS